MASALQDAPIIIWAPQPGPQEAFVKCPVFEVVYGGARGGGKTDACIGGDWPLHAQAYGVQAKGIFVRKSVSHLEAAIARSQELYPKLSARWGEQKKTWVFPNGATLKFRHLQSDRDAEDYQGHDYTRVYVEELTNYPDPSPVNKLKATLRSAAGVPCGFRATCNPGGPGHLWVKERYIDPDPRGFKVVTEAYTNPFTNEETEIGRVFIPARLDDNPKLLETDPGYVARLYQSGSSQLVRAWLSGDWDIVEGAFFECWRPHLHVIKPFATPDHWTRFRSMDWGSAKPFSVGWWAVASEDFALPETGRIIPKGAMVRTREWYGNRHGKPNVGLKLTAKEVAEGIVTRERGEAISYGVLDPSAFASDGGPSIAETLFEHSRALAAKDPSLRPLTFRKADNRRIARGGAMGGWDQLRARLIGEEGRPMIYTFATCTDSIRTLPILQHDKVNAEDLDTEAEDHAADDWRYACMSRPVTAAPPAKETLSQGLAGATLDDMWELHEKGLKRKERLY